MKHSKIKTGQKIGYLCDDGIIAAATVTDRLNDNITIQCETDGTSNSYLRRGFVIDLKNDRLKIFADIKLLNKEIEKSCHQLYDKWITILKAKCRHNSSIDIHTFSNDIDISICDTHPQMLLTIIKENYQKDIANYTYDNVLRSLICWAALIKCDERKCGGQYKLICQCDFKEYFYYMLMMIIRVTEVKDDINDVKDDENKIKNNEIEDILAALKRSPSCVVDVICNNLRLAFKQQYYFNVDGYLDTFAEYMKEWLRFSFYDFECKRCGSFNQSVMINRMYVYSTTLNHCRVCGSQRKQTHMHDHQLKDIDINLDVLPLNKSNKAINWFCKTFINYIHSQNEHFAVVEQNVKESLIQPSCDTVTRIDEYLRLSNDMFMDKTNKYETFDDFLQLIRFWHTFDSITELRIKLNLNYYFHHVWGDKISILEFMESIGVSKHHHEILANCYLTALFHTANNADKLFETMMVLQDMKYNKSILCIDFKYLTLFRKLRKVPSVVTFAHELLQQFKRKISDAFGLVEILCNYKLNINTFWIFLVKESKTTPLVNIIRKSLHYGVYSDIVKFCCEHAKKPDQQKVTEYRKKYIGCDGIAGVPTDAVVNLLQLWRSSFNDLVVQQMTCVLAYYRWHEALVPDFVVLAKECEIYQERMLQILENACGKDASKHNVIELAMKLPTRDAEKLLSMIKLVQKYNAAKNEIVQNDTKLAMSSRMIEARGNYVMPQFESSKEFKEFNELKINLDYEKKENMMNYSWYDTGQLIRYDVRQPKYDS
eukprot:418608_1